MTRQLCFFLVFSSWICGLFLICLSPPVSDFSQTDLESGLINPEPTMELTLKNSSRSRSGIPIGELVDLEFFTSDSILERLGHDYILEISVDSTVLEESPTNSNLFFRLFFETF